jgi:transposase
VGVRSVPHREHAHASRRPTFARNPTAWAWHPGHATRRLRKAGKPFKVVVVAAMRKLLTILNIMLKENRPWDAGKLQTA